MSDASSCVPSSPSVLAETPPSSLPSPSLSSLSLTDNKEVSEEDRKQATRLKTVANEAFASMR